MPLRPPVRTRSGLRPAAISPCRAHAVDWALTAPPPAIRQPPAAVCSRISQRVPRARGARAADRLKRGAGRVGVAGDAVREAPAAVGVLRAAQPAQRAPSRPRLPAARSAITAKAVRLTWPPKEPSLAASLAQRLDEVTAGEVPRVELRPGEGEDRAREVSGARDVGDVAAQEAQPGWSRPPGRRAGCAQRPRARAWPSRSSRRPSRRPARRRSLRRGSAARRARKRPRAVSRQPAPRQPARHDGDEQRSCSAGRARSFAPRSAPCRHSNRSR